MKNPHPDQTPSIYQMRALEFAELAGRAAGAVARDTLEPKAVSLSRDLAAEAAHCARLALEVQPSST